MPGIWQEPTARGPVPFQIMRQNEARATKTETGIRVVHFTSELEGTAEQQSAGEMDSDGDVTQHKW